MATSFITIEHDHHMSKMLPDEFFLGVAHRGTNPGFSAPAAQLWRTMYFCGGRSTKCSKVLKTSFSPKLQSEVSSADRMFMNKAAQGGMAEVQMGQLASEKASAQPVKDFGQRMVTAYGQNNTHAARL